MTEALKLAIADFPLPACENCEDEEVLQAFLAERRRRLGEVLPLYVRAKAAENQHAQSFPIVKARLLTPANEIVVLLRRKLEESTENPPVEAAGKSFLYSEVGKPVDYALFQVSRSPDDILHVTQRQIERVAVQPNSTLLFIIQSTGRCIVPINVHKGAAHPTENPEFLRILTAHGREHRARMPDAMMEIEKKERWKKPKKGEASGNQVVPHFTPAQETEFSQRLLERLSRPSLRLATGQENERPVVTHPDLWHVE